MGLVIKHDIWTFTLLAVTPRGGSLTSLGTHGWWNGPKVNFLVMGLGGLGCGSGAWLGFLHGFTKGLAKLGSGAVTVLVSSKGAGVLQDFFIWIVGTLDTGAARTGTLWVWLIAGLVGAFSKLAICTTAGIWTLLYRHAGALDWRWQYRATKIGLWGGDQKAVWTREGLLADGPWLGT